VPTVTKQKIIRLNVCMTVCVSKDSCFKIFQHFSSYVNIKMFVFICGNFYMCRDKRSMALVLWEPPAGRINPVLSRQGRDQTEEDNNNTSVVDLNSLSTSGYALQTICSRILI